MEKKRIILHYDMDCFYASIEIRDNQKLKGKPIIVGGGVVTTASYEARTYGIKSAMSVVEAKRLCPSLIVVPVNKKKYIYESERIHNLIKLLSKKVEFIALDEGYVDITEIAKKYPNIEYIARKFKIGIKKNIGVTCSVGVGFNKLSAKIASEINKPNGIFIFKNRKDFIEYILDKNIKIFPGVGKKFNEELQKNKLIKIRDIYRYSLKYLQIKYGTSRGELLYSYSRGIDNREIEEEKSNHSIGHENTYRILLTSEIEVQREINILFQKVYERMNEENFLCKSIGIKIKYKNFETIAKSKTFNIYTKDKDLLIENMNALLEKVNYDKEIRLVGVYLGILISENKSQLEIKF